jgi:energy-coupling factor transport system permease protein
MISDITLGQFFPGYSPIHKLDPRTKIILSVLFIVTVFLANNPITLAFLALITLVLIYISRISFKVMFKAIKPLVFILTFTALLNIFLTKGDGAPLVSVWVIKIYEEGIVRAAFMFFRVIIFILSSTVLLTYTTSPISLTDGLESLLAPLKKIKVPVHAFAMMMSIALRFIPILVEETEKIMNAQKSRGADFSSGGLIKRAKALIPILIPLLASAFNRADELATAMECRCYRGDKNRTKLVKLEYKARDAIFAVAFVLIFGAVILLRILPYEFEINSVVFKIFFYKI